jgi:hypothetical protein
MLDKTGAFSQLNRERSGLQSISEQLEWDTGHWPVLAGDPPDGTEAGVELEIQAKVSSVAQLFRSASRRPERAGRPFHPFFTHTLNAARQHVFDRVAASKYAHERLRCNTVLATETRLAYFGAR